MGGLSSQYARSLKPQKYSDKCKSCKTRESLKSITVVFLSLLSLPLAAFFALYMLKHYYYPVTIKHPEFHLIKEGGYSFFQPVLK